LSNRFRSIQVDFSPSTLGRGILTTSRLAWFLLICAAITWSAVIYRTYVHLHQQSQNEGAIRHLAAKAETESKIRASTRQSPLPLERVVAINKVVDQLNLPWSGLFDALDSLYFPNVAILAVEPIAPRSQILIQAEARNAEQMVAYLTLLKGTALFKDARIKSHEIHEADPNKPIRFLVESTWNKVPI